ncbi:hypothetical protein Dimus_004009 [Dionaea muscipula]
MAFNVPLNYKKGEDPKRYDFFEENFMSMCQLKRENGVWWLWTGENRRMDDEDEVVNNKNAPTENLEENPEGFEWETGEEMEKEDEVEELGLEEKFYDAEDEVEEPADVIIQVLEVPALVSDQQKETTAAGVDPSGPTGTISDSEFLKIQSKFDRTREKGFKLSWIMLVQRMPDFKHCCSKPHFNPNHRIKLHLNLRKSTRQS